MNERCMKIFWPLLCNKTVPRNEYFYKTKSVLSCADGLKRKYKSLVGSLLKRQGTFKSIFVRAKWISNLAQCTVWNGHSLDSCKRNLEPILRWKKVLLLKKKQYVLLFRQAPVSCFGYLQSKLSHHYIMIKVVIVLIFL